VAVTTVTVGYDSDVGQVAAPARRQRRWSLRVLKDTGPGGRSGRVRALTAWSSRWAFLDSDPATAS
jgi:hypothetical protein